MSNRYKPILPAPVAPRPNAAEATNTVLPTSSGTLRQRRSSVRIACNGCRAKRTACDGNRPTCAPCAKRGSPCVYVSASSTEPQSVVMKREMEALRKKHDSLAEIFDMLREMPEDKSEEVLRKLRSLAALDPVVFLSSLRSNKPVDGALPRYVLVRPPPHDSEEFELMLRHNIAYPTLLPLDASAVSVTIFSPERLLTSVSLRDASSALASLGSSQPSPGPPSPTPVNSLNLELTASSTSYCDDRLLVLEISYWSSTSIPNWLAAQLLSLYLKTDHPTLGLFDAELFLRDIIARRHRYCSPLLVCSILLWACHAYRTLLPDLGSLDEDFLAEANLLWEHDQHRDSLPTLAAAQLLNLNSIYNGDNSELHYLEAGSRMAQRMGLFGDFRTRTPVPTEHEPSSSQDDWKRAVAHTAWGVYNCVAMNAFMFQNCEPAVALPPLLDTPAILNDRQADEEVSDGAQAHNLPDYMGRTFPALCGFWVITTKWTSRYYLPDPEPVVGRIPWAFAEAIFEELLVWADGLHLRLARGDQTPHHSTILHIWYHASISQLFRPFTATPLDKSPLRVNPAESLRADAISRASLHQLKHMTLIFPYTYSCSSYAIFWHMALLYVANAALEDSDDTQWRAYFTICLNCYADLFGTFRVAGGIMRSLLSIALRKGMLTGVEAQDILQRVSAKGRHYEAVKVAMSGFVVDLNLAVTDRNAAQLKPLAELFDNLRLFYEFVHTDMPDGSRMGGTDHPHVDSGT